MKYLERFRMPPGTAVRLNDIDPGFKNHREGHGEPGNEIERIRNKYY